MPARIERNVVLPAPFGPMIATSSPRVASSDTPLSASRSPKRLLIARASRTRARSVAIASTDSGIGPTVVGLPESRAMRLVFIGDVVGGTGRRALEAVMPELRSRYEPDFLVVNGENAAGGLGITEKIARDWLAGGIDAITLGNHAYKQRDVYEFLDREERIVR